MLIHIGPPKTGTSAIQYWLNCNRKILTENGYYYPRHAIDKNKVSSGNILSIFDLNNQKLSINNKKIRILLKKFKHSNAHTLLLSSEIFFFTDLELLSRLFGNTKFIAYIISPLDFLESGYIQSVKRRGNTETITLSTKLNSPTAELKDAISRIGMKRFHLRAYNKDLFEHGDVVDDFLSFIKITRHSRLSSHKINPSYCFEALEVKRWLNQFHMDSAIDSMIDAVLQQFDQSNRYFSCIPPAVYEKYRIQSIDSLADFCGRYEVVNGDRLMKLVRKRSQRAYRKQALTEEEVAAVASFIKMKIKPLYFYICRYIHAQSSMDCGMSGYRKSFTDLPPKSIFSNPCGSFSFHPISWEQKLRLLLIRWRRLYVFFDSMSRRIRKS